MSKKGQLKRAIGDLEREIAALEQKRERSQSAIMRAMIKGEKPNPEDTQYFDAFSALIDESRENLRKLVQELNELQHKK